MKKFLLLIIFLFMSMSLAYGVANDNRTSYKSMLESHRLQHETCMNIVDNFRYDHQFGNYMKYRCQLFESDRQRMLSSIYTITSQNNVNGAVESFTQAKSVFVVNLNNNEINTYKSIVQEYCKYNAYKYNKKDPQACSAGRINSLFGKN